MNFYYVEELGCCRYWLLRDSLKLNILAEEGRDHGIGVDIFAKASLVVGGRAYHEQYGVRNTGASFCKHGLQTRLTSYT